jgi:hypothetical protein
LAYLPPNPLLCPPDVEKKRGKGRRELTLNLLDAYKFLVGITSSPAQARMRKHGMGGRKRGSRGRRRVWGRGGEKS